jgi:hypothetical protein
MMNLNCFVYPSALQTYCNSTSVLLSAVSKSKCPFPSGSLRIVTFKKFVRHFCYKKKNLCMRVIITRAQVIEDFEKMSFFF